MDLRTNHFVTIDLHQAFDRLERLPHRIDAIDPPFTHGIEIRHVASIDLKVALRVTTSPPIECAALERNNRVRLDGRAAARTSGRQCDRQDSDSSERSSKHTAS